MQIIVTGGSGFIGSNLVWELAERNPEAKLTVIDDYTSGDFKNLSGFGGDVIAQGCEHLDWKHYFGKQDIRAIYHLASITDTTVRDQREMIWKNVEGFRRVLRFSQSRGIKVVYASSGATYGQAEGIMHEEQHPAPANVYGFSKCILDNLAAEAAANGLNVCGVRYFNVYGPREAHKGKMASMIYQLYQQLKAGENPKVFKQGEQKRDFVYVKDAVAGTLQAGKCETPGVYNIGSGVATSFNQVIDSLKRACGLAAGQQPTEYIENPYADFYQNHTEADLTRSKDQLGYEPQWDIDHGIEDYVTWLRTG